MALLAHTLGFTLRACSGPAEKRVESLLVKNEAYGGLWVSLRQV